MKLHQWAILIYVSLNQTDCLELYRHYEWEHIKGPTISPDKGTMGRGVQIKKGENRGEEMVAADRTDKKKSRKWVKRKEEAQDTGHTGQGDRKASEWPILGHSPLGWLGENATAHYMLCLCSVDEQCTIMLPCCCSSSHTAACLWGGRYCCFCGSPANSLCAHQTSHTCSA